MNCTRGLQYHHLNLVTGAQNGWNRMSNGQRLSLAAKVMGLALALGFLTIKAGASKGMAALIIVPAAYYKGLKLASNFLEELMHRYSFRIVQVNLEEKPPAQVEKEQTLLPFD